MDIRDRKMPEWAPENAGAEFASSVLPGLKDIERPCLRITGERKEFSPKDYAKGVISGDRSMLSRTITIIESNASKHFHTSQEIIRLIMPYTGNSMRVGITGVPGVGKSTFIEALGNMLCGSGKRVAVLAVDPSSTRSGGSILGDKTRMENLSKNRNAFIRPSPSGGVLGGVNRKSRETILLCEAAGFEIILVETVGVGQSETSVRSMVDFFLMLAIAGAGDELQGIKKGIIEMADAILVNKADGDNYNRAVAAKAEYEQALHYLRPAAAGWVTRAYTASALQNSGIKEIWGVICSFYDIMGSNGYILENRNKQTMTWVRHMVDEYIKNKVYENEKIKDIFKKGEGLMLDGLLAPGAAASHIIDGIKKVFSDSFF